MLRELQIKDLALIEKLRIGFGPGLNVLTGETGAGKSIVVDGLMLALGSRGEMELIRTEAAEAVVEAAFEAGAHPGIRALLAAQGITAPTEEYLFLRRHLPREGKSRAYVNGTLALAGTLRELGEFLVDIHGQQDAPLLLNRRRHLELLDAFAGLGDPVAAYRDRYRRLCDLEAECGDLSGGERRKEERRDFLSHQVQEIRAAALAEGEEEALRVERVRLAHSEELLQAIEAAYGALEGGEGAILEMLGAVRARLREGERIDPDLASLSPMVEEGAALLKEVALTLRDYRAKVRSDPDRLEAVEARLYTISRLKKKYGDSVLAIQQALREAEAELARLSGVADRIQEIEREIGELEADLWREAERLSAARTQAAGRLQQAVRAEIRALGMPKADFAVALGRVSDGEGPRRACLQATGMDEAEFLIAPNPGEGLKPLRKIASGGELSRTMLALKGILAAADETPTLIFDEVDAGIGGGMGEVVGKKLWRLARVRQVICITHLPQLAAFADRHLQVEKRTGRGRTEAVLRTLDAPGRVREIARMLGGPGRSQTPLTHAEELLTAAERWKRGR
ncbi:MAG: DNA repair protein RecN [Candidatus Methylomirabilales bacterium]